MSFGFARPLQDDERLELGAFDGEADPFIFPGLAVVTFEAELDVDEPKAGGKDDAPLKVKGRRVRPVSAKLTWQKEFDKEALAYLEALISGPHNGKPREISHPDAEVYKVSAVLFHKVGKIERTPRTRTVDISGKSSAKPKNTTSGGAKGTGAAGSGGEAAKWSFGTPVGQPGSGSTKKIGSNNNTVGGFDDPADAPKAEPPK